MLAYLGFTLAVLGAAFYFKDLAAVSVVGGICFILVGLSQHMTDIIKALLGLTGALKTLVKLLKE